MTAAVKQEDLFCLFAGRDTSSYRLYLYCRQSPVYAQIARCAISTKARVNISSKTFTYCSSLRKIAFIDLEIEAAFGVEALPVFNK